MSAKQTIREMLKRLPTPFDRWAENSVMCVMALGSPWHRAMRSLYAKIGPPRDQVRQGPFAGMRYVPFLHVSVPSKIYGTYELELRDVVDEIGRSDVDLLVNIGSAEGYYAVGFARRRPDLKIVCFEMSDVVRNDLQRLIRANAVEDRVQVKGRCDVDALNGVLEGARHPVILCDVEGYEIELMDQQRLPALRQSTILLELHEHERPGLTETIRKRFEATHSIRSIASRPRRREDLPPMRGPLTDEEFEHATTEHRIAQQQWFYMVPRNPDAV